MLIWPSAVKVFFNNYKINSSINNNKYLLAMFNTIKINNDNNKYDVFAFKAVKCPYYNYLKNNKKIKTKILLFYHFKITYLEEVSFII